MYTRFFGLHHPPFSIAPDPRYLFMSERHREALAHLLYGLNGGGGFVLLTGEIGAGKTTICRLFLEQMPERCNVAYIFNPKQTAVELLQSVCDEFGIVVPPPASTALVQTEKNFIDPLNDFLLQAHALEQNNILIIDEAQNLELDVLEQLRLLTNLETNERKLLQIILIGQPELRAILARPELEQLSQRVIARFHLDALSQKETTHYILHRLTIAGMAQQSPFGAAMMRRIHGVSKGIPRRINLLCDRALLGAYARGKSQVDAKTLALASHEIFGKQVKNKRQATFSWPATAMVFSVLAVLLPSVGGLIGMMAFDSNFLPVLGQTKAVVPSMTTEFLIKEALQNARPSSIPVSPPVPLVTTSAPVTTDAPTTPIIAPALTSDVRDLQQAFRQLGQLWALELGNGNSCQAAQRQNTYCFISKKGLAEIRQLNQPGILTLRDDQGKKYYALLMALNKDSATLRLGELTQAVKLDALAMRWEGDFITLWRGPAGYMTRPVRIANRSTREWVVSRLARVPELPPLPALPSSVATDALTARVRQFQVAQGLMPDGVASAQTLMRLAFLAGDAGPVLPIQDAMLTTLLGRK